MERFLEIVRLVLSSLFLAWVSFTVGKDAIQQDKLDDEFINFGLETNAELIGYEHVDAGKRLSGDRPVLTYKPIGGELTYRHVANEYGLISSYGKKVLPNQKIVITYLIEKPWIARVQAWHSSKTGIIKFLSAVCAWLSVVSLVMAMRIIRSITSPMNEGS